MWGLSPSGERTWELQGHQTQLAHGRQAATWASCFSITMFGNSAFLAPEASFRQRVPLPLVPCSLLTSLCFSFWTLLSLLSYPFKSAVVGQLQYPSSRPVRPAPSGRQCLTLMDRKQRQGGSPRTVHSLVQWAVSDWRFMTGIQDQPHYM